MMSYENFLHLLMGGWFVLAIWVGITLYKAHKEKYDED